MSLRLWYFSLSLPFSFWLMRSFSSLVSSQGDSRRVEKPRSSPSCLGPNQRRKDLNIDYRAYMDRMFPQRFLIILAEPPHSIKRKHLIDQMHASHSVSPLFHACNASSVRNIALLPQNSQQSQQKPDSSPWTHGLLPQLQDHRQTANRRIPLQHLPHRRQEPRVKSAHPNAHSRGAR